MICEVQNVYFKYKKIISDFFNWIKDASVLVKIAIIISILLTVFNISGNIFISQKTFEINETVDIYVSNQKEAVLCNINEYIDLSDFLNMLIDDIGSILKTSFLIIISLIVGYIVCCLCKPLDLIRDVVKWFAEVDFDICAIRILMIYDAISFGFSLYTIYSFASIH